MTSPLRASRRYCRQESRCSRLQFPDMNDLVPSLLAKFDDSELYCSVLLVGSAARGDLTTYSDIDLIFYHEGVPGDYDRLDYRLRYFAKEGKEADGAEPPRLISLSVRSFCETEKALDDPLEAIRYIQGLRDGHILRDSADRLARLKKAADEFTWTGELQTRACQRASYELAGCAEEVHKILRGLSIGDQGALFNGALGIILNMPMVVALARGILSGGDNLFNFQVREAVGENSRWSRCLQLASGSFPLSPPPGMPNFPPIALQAIAAFWLFDETARVIDDILLAEDRAVIHCALGIARESMLVPSII